MIPYLIVGAVFGFLFGYLVGRMDAITSLVKQRESSSFISGLVREEKAKERSRIQIDDKKFVTDVSTDDLQSSTTTPLGSVTSSNDDISAAKHKLAQLKKLKG
jgi:hypothetical protein